MEYIPFMEMLPIKKKKVTWYVTVTLGVRSYMIGAWLYYHKLANLSRYNFSWFKFSLENIFIDGPMWWKLNNGENCTCRLYFSPSPSLAFFLFKLHRFHCTFTHWMFQFSDKVMNGCRSPINICVLSSVLSYFSLFLCTIPVV